VSEEFTLTIKVSKLENNEQVRCVNNSEVCSKEWQVHIIGEEENSKFELYLCGLHFALWSLIIHIEALEKAGKRIKVI